MSEVMKLKAFQRRHRCSAILQAALSNQLCQMRQGHKKREQRQMEMIKKSIKKRESKKNSMKSDEANLSHIDRNDVNYHYYINGCIFYVILQKTTRICTRQTGNCNHAGCLSINGCQGLTHQRPESQISCQPGLELHCYDNTRLHRRQRKGPQAFKPRKHVDPTTLPTEKQEIFGGAGDIIRAIQRWEWMGRPRR